MRREGYWGNNLELLTFSDLTKLDINIYISLDQEVSEFQIIYPKNRWNKNLSGDNMKSWGYWIVKMKFRSVVKKIKYKANEYLLKLPQSKRIT